MDSNPAPVPRYYLALDGQVAGPYSLDALREMASVHAFTRDTLATPEGSENWRPIHTIPALSDTLFPATAKFQLKEKAFTETADSDRPVSVDELLRTNLDSEIRHVAPADYTTPSAPKSAGSSRNRDFLFSIICANALGLAAYAIFPSHPFILIPLLAYFVVINLGLYWIFYHVMSRY